MHMVCAQTEQQPVDVALYRLWSVDGIYGYERGWRSNFRSNPGWVHVNRTWGAKLVDDPTTDIGTTSRNLKLRYQ